jgi:hypothetical protein
MSDGSYNTKVYEKQGGNEMVVASGGQITVESGGKIVDANGANVVQDVLAVGIADMSADASYFVTAPHAGAISRIYAVVDGAISTADLVVTAKIGGAAVTNGAVTLPTVGSGAGARALATPTAANTVAAGDIIELAVTGGGSGGSPRGRVTLLIDRA